MYVPKIAALTSVMTLALAGVVAVAPGAQAACGSGTYGGGAGTSGDPYMIASDAHLNTLQSTSGDWSCHFVQTAPIDLTGTTWNSGIGERFGALFEGSYDGGNHLISGLRIEGGSDLGLFGYVFDPGTIERVSFSGDVVSTGNNVGGIVGVLDSATLRDSNFTGSVSSSIDEGGFFGFQVGGLVGLQVGSGSSLSDSYSTGSVSGRDRVGGAVGQAWNGSIDRVYSTGSATGLVGAGTNIGGLIGYNATDANSGGATVTDSYARGAVTGHNLVGGLTGGGANTITITDSYATGLVTTTNNPGGLTAQGGDAQESFWDSQTTGLSTSGTGTAKTTEQMTSLATFTDANWSIAQGYDATKTWGIDPDINDGYPFLVSLYASYLDGSGTASASSPEYAFTFWLDSGEQCTDISPQVVQRGEAFTLPGALAGCRREGTEIVGWTIPWSDRVFAPGTVVRVVDSQQFTAVLKEPSVRVVYDANVAADDSCRNGGEEIAVEDRTRTQTLMREAMSGWPLASTAPCVPDGVVLQRWNTSGDGSGRIFDLGASVPEEWIDDPENVRRLYAVWGR